MNFLNPIFLWALPLISIPTLLHLIERRPPKKMIFSHIDWIRHAHESLIPKKKLKDLLLLIIRTGLLLFLVMFFSRPVIQKTPISVGGAKNDIVLLMDVSASMGALHGGQTALDLAKDVAQNIQRKLTPGDQMALIVFSDQIVKEIALTSDRSKILGAIESLENSHRGTDISSALAQAYKMLESSIGQQKSILILSDQAKHAWTSVSDRRPLWDGYDAQTRVVLYQVVPPSDNSGFHNVALATSEEGVLKGQAHYHFTKGKREDNRWTLSINDRVVDQGLTSRLTLQAQFPSGGFYSGVLSKPNDKAPFDDKFFVAGRVPPGFRLLIVDGESGLAPSDAESYYLKSALESPRDPRLESLRVIRPESLPQENLSQVDVIVLANVLNAGGRESDLRSWVEKGGGLFISAGSHWPKGSQDVFGFTRPLAFITTKSVLTTPNLKAPFIAHMNEGDLFEWDQMWATTYTTYDTDAASESLLSFANGDPLLIRKHVGAGFVLVWTTSLDRSWTNIPTKPAFAPLVRELMSSLADPLREQDSLNGWVGEPFQARIPLTVRQVTIFTPDGGATTGLIPKPGLMELKSPQQPGLYRVKTNQEQTGFVFAINTSNLEKEGDLSVIDIEDIRPSFPKASLLWVPTSGDGAGAILSALHGQEATTLFLILVFLLVCLEMLLSWPRRATAAFLILMFVAPISAEGGNRFVFAQLEHEGAWDPYPGVEIRIFQSIKQMTNIPFEPSRKKVSLSNDEIFEQPFLLVKGHAALRLDGNEKRRLKEFIDRGGFVFFDDTMADSRGLFSQSVRELMRDVYPDRNFQKLSMDHALFRSFFLLRHVSGRRVSEKYLEGLDVGGSGGGEGRTAVLLCSNDLLGAWVRDNLGQYLFTCEPGGEMQRWEAIKLTINIIYFSLTGTYKKDAVHQPFIEQKLGS